MAATGSSNTLSSLDAGQLDILSVPKAWKNPNWKPSNRRNKNVKQILSELARKEASALQAANEAATAAAEAVEAAKARQDGGESGDGDVSMKDGVDEDGVPVSELMAAATAAADAVTALASSGPSVTYSNIEAAPSMHPSSRRPYCDLTGLAGPYTDPKNLLRYHNKEVYAYTCSFNQEQADRYLEARNANFTLK